MINKIGKNIAAPLSSGADALPSPSECVRWAASRGLAAKPYGRVPLAAQYRIDRSDSRLKAIAEGIVHALGRDSELLVVADDWSTYHEDEMRQINAIRAEAGEPRRLFDAPGHEMKRREADLRLRLIAFILGTHSRWSAYLYAFPSQTTLLLWEGDLIDLWTARPGTIGKFDKFLPRSKSG